MSDTHGVDDTEEFEDIDLADAEYGEDDDAGEDDLGAGPEPLPLTVEERARLLGWKPKSEMRDPSRWRPAAEFIAHGEQTLPIMRETNRRLTERVGRLEGRLGDMDALRNTVEEQKAEMARLRTVAQRADETGYNRALAELKSQQRQAVEAGDTEVYDQVEERIAAIQAARVTETASPPPPPPAPPAGQPVVDPAYPAFVAANPWFNQDQRLKNAMIANHNAVMAAHPEKTIAEQLVIARERLKADFPNNPAFAQDAPPAEPDLDPEYDDMPPEEPRPAAPRPRAAPVLRPSNQAGGAPPRPNGRNPLDRITDADDRAAVRKGWLAQRAYDPEHTLAEAVALYENPRLDVLTMRARRKKA